MAGCENCNNPFTYRRSLCVQCYEDEMADHDAEIQSIEVDEVPCPVCRPKVSDEYCSHCNDLGYVQV